MYEHFFLYHDLAVSKKATASPKPGVVTNQKLTKSLFTQPLTHASPTQERSNMGYHLKARFHSPSAAPPGSTIQARFQPFSPFTRNSNYSRQGFQASLS